MIIKKLQSVSGGMFPGAEYNEKKVKEGVAELAGFANVSGNFIHTLQTLHSVGIDCGHEVEEYLQGCSQTYGNTKSTRWQLHLALSCKGHEKTKEQLVGIAHAMMREYGADKQPYFIYFHHDTDNNHVHILSTRVTPVGRLIQDHNDYRSLNAALNRVLKGEQKNDISRIMGYNFTTEGQFMNIAREFIFKADVSESNSNTLVLYHGGVAVFAIDKKELASVLAMRKGDERLKAQRDAAAKRLKAIIIKYRKMSLSQFPPQGDSRLNSQTTDTQKERAKNRKDLMKEKKARIHPDIKKLAGADGKPLSEVEQYRFNWFIEQLHSKLGIAIHFQKDKNGIVRGYGIIDHNNKVALNGSDVMRLADIINLKEWQGKQQDKTNKKVNERASETSRSSAWHKSDKSVHKNSSVFVKKPVKAKVYTSDSTLNIYRSIFTHKVASSDGRHNLCISFADGSSYSHELSDEQFRWYSKASTDEEKDDIAIRLAAFLFPRQIYDAYRRQQLEDYINYRKNSFRLPKGIGLRFYKHYNHNWYLETDGYRCNIKYKLEKDEVARLYHLDRNSPEFAKAKRDIFFVRYTKEEIDALNRRLNYDTVSPHQYTARGNSVNDIKAFTSQHAVIMQNLALALSTSAENGANREFEVGGHMNLEEVDDERRFHRGLSM